jgi:hypothetical protein
MSGRRIAGLQNADSKAKVALALLYIGFQARRFERLLEACDGNVEQAERVWRELYRLERAR